MTVLRDLFPCVLSKVLVTLQCTLVQRRYAMGEELEMSMFKELILSLNSFQLVRRFVGGHWYLIADYQRDTQYWLTYRPGGYHILGVEDWE